MAEYEETYIQKLRTGENIDSLLVRLDGLVFGTKLMNNWWVAEGETIKIYQGYIRQEGYILDWQTSKESTKKGRAKLERKVFRNYKETEPFPAIIYGDYFRETIPLREGSYDKERVILHAICIMGEHIILNPKARVEKRIEKICLLDD